MKGKDIAASLPPTGGPAREQAILRLIREGYGLLKWVPLSVDVGPYRATFYVTAEPLMLGESWEDGFYPGVNADTMQKVADYFNATLLTPKLVDEIWKKANIRLDPFVGMTATAQDVARMNETNTFVRHSDLIKSRIRDAKRNFRGRPPLVANIGKYWTVSAYTSVGGRTQGGATAAENYGFFSSKSGASSTATAIPNVAATQTVGHRHDLSHSDYSQVIMLVARSVQLCIPAGMSGLGDYYHCTDGGACNAPGGSGRIKCVDIYDLANDPALASLVSHEGTINMRMPSVGYQRPEGCALLAMSGIGETSRAAEAFGIETCGRTPPPAGQVGRTSTATGKGKDMIPRRTKIGEKGSDVVAWQRFLISKGYDLSPYGADGDHGAKTEAASLAYEKATAGTSAKGSKRASMTSSGKLNASDYVLGAGVVILGIGAGYVAYQKFSGKY